MTDRWAEWLASRRDGGDPNVRQASLAQLAVWRDLVLDGANLSDGDHLLDVGTGEGLIGFGALGRLPSGRVTFSDISGDALDLCRSTALALGLADRCAFVEAAADNLTPIPSESVDVVTTRSVLIYVVDKDRAFAEFWRVLRRGGRLSLFEPINRYMFPEPAGEFVGYAAGGVEDLVAKLAAVRTAGRDGAGPMMDFDDARLLSFAEEAGFTNIEVILRRQLREECLPRPWESFLASSPNPLVPSWGLVLQQTLGPMELERFEHYMKPRVEIGRRLVRSALATLTATRA